MKRKRKRGLTFDPSFAPNLVDDSRNVPKQPPWKWVNGKPDKASFYGRLAASVGCLMLACGCASYENAVWTPDGLNYTVSIDHQTHDAASYIGLTWNLKPHK